MTSVTVDVRENFNAHKDVATSLSSRSRDLRNKSIKRNILEMKISALQRELKLLISDDPGAVPKDEVATVAARPNRLKKLLSE